LQQAKKMMEENIRAECKANPWMRRNLEGLESADVEMEVEYVAPTEEELKFQRVEQNVRILEKLNALPTPKVMNTSLGARSETDASKLAAGCKNQWPF
jgi:hypothetical protein